jgi:probable HAF family extracellular repeat protein
MMSAFSRKYGMFTEQSFTQHNRFQQFPNHQLQPIDTAELIVRIKGEVMKRLLLSIMLVVAVWAGAASQAGAFQYTITDLGVSLPQSETWKGYQINNQGQIAGNSPSGAFVWEKGLKTYIGEVTSVSDINDAGYVVGAGLEVGFLWKDGIKYSLPMEDSVGINNSGNVIGYNHFGNTPYATATLLKDGALTDIGSLGFESFAVAINDNGNVAGGSWNLTDNPHAFFYENGVIKDIGTFGGSRSWASGINNSDQVVGYAETSAGNFHAFLWEDGVMQDIGTLGNKSFAVGINKNGQIVGNSDTATGAAHAFIWDKIAGMVDLNNLTDSMAGWELAAATDINESGQIVGYGTYNGETHGFLLSQSVAPEPPAGTPEPATFLLVGFGLIGFIKFRKKSCNRTV